MNDQQEILDTHEVSQDTELKVVRNITTNYFNDVIWKQMQGMAQTFFQSKAVPSCYTNTAQIVVGLQTGLEMGMKPMESLKSLYIVNGNLTIWGAATIRRLREHGYTIEYTKETSKSCTAIVRKNNEEYKDTFRFEDAEASGWVYDRYNKLKIGWKEGQNRKMKMRYGVISAIIKSFIPEVLGSATDITEVAEDFEVLETVVDKERKDKKKIDIKKSEVESTDLDDFLKKREKELETKEINKVNDKLPIDKLNNKDE